MPDPSLPDGFRSPPRIAERSAGVDPGGRCHGGGPATFCALQLAFSILVETPDLAAAILPAVKLTVDDLAGARPGARIEAVGGPVPVTQHLAVAPGVATADGVPAVRASGTYEVGGARVTGVDPAAWPRAALDRG